MLSTSADILKKRDVWKLWVICRWRNILLQVSKGCKEQTGHWVLEYVLFQLCMGTDIFSYKRTLHCSQRKKPIVNTCPSPGMILLIFCVSGHQGVIVLDMMENQRVQV